MYNICRCRCERNARDTKKKQRIASFTKIWRRFLCHIARMEKRLRRETTDTHARELYRLGQVDRAFFAAFTNTCFPRSLRWRYSREMIGNDSIEGTCLALSGRKTDPRQGSAPGWTRGTRYARGIFVRIGALTKDRNLTVVLQCVLDSLRRAE